MGIGKNYKKPKRVFVDYSNIILKWDIAFLGVTQRQ